MREITIDHCSWHYWFANSGSSADTRDFCAYVRSVVFGMLLFLFMAFTIAVYAAVSGLSVGWLVAVIFNGYVEPEAAIPGLVINGGIPLIVLLFLSARKLGETAKDNSFVSNAYTTFKDKICFKVRVE